MSDTTKTNTEPIVVQVKGKDDKTYYPATFDYDVAEIKCRVQILVKAVNEDGQISKHIVNSNVLSGSYEDKCRISEGNVLKDNLSACRFWVNGDMLFGKTNRKLMDLGIEPMISLTLMAPATPTGDVPSPHDDFEDDTDFED